MSNDATWLPAEIDLLISLVRERRELYDQSTAGNHEIDEESFLTLNESEIKELIPEIGICKKFLLKYNAFLIERATVRKLLDSTEEGLIIKNSYRSSKQFLRSNLCTLIIKNELKHSDDKRISTERFKQLAQEINNIFIHEDPSIYYLPCTRGVTGKAVVARGKLWSTYVHQRKIYREAGLIKKQITVEPSTSNDKRFVDISGEDEDSLIWLKNNSQPFEDVS
ncbi:hypothetical protein ILUMI_12063 [Ignelater luminosus]|uniref:Uncharacterized protein n=1 Tax=Ignelater luminosus TaxID=2038154 RepID=A0A8K0CX82_IGNLU|nr:hypothetical protein ILUMI_12063 [Ignelater luminosus]